MVRQRSWAAWGIALVVSTAAMTATAQAATVSSGALRVTVDRGPWHLVVRDGRGRPVLTEATRAGNDAGGRLGFNADGVWRHATRVTAVTRRGTALAATVATDDPAGRRLAVRIVPGADRSLRITSTVSSPAGVTASGAGFAMREDEGFLGFGERSNAVDQRGNDVESYVAEGPYTEKDNVAVAGLLPKDGYHPRLDATYFPMPWFVSTAGYGVLVRNDETSMHHLGTQAKNIWSVETASSTLGLQVFPGPRPVDVVRRLSATLGRQPALVSPAVLGPWFQPDPDETDASAIAQLQAADAPASVGQTYTHYLPCGRNVGRADSERALSAAYHDAGYAATTYFNPMICREYDTAWSAAAAAGVLTKHLDGTPYVYDYMGARRYTVSQVDFSHPQAPAFYGDLLQQAVDNGFDGWMEDFGEYTPLDSLSADGLPAAAEHNRYPLLYHGAAWAFQQRTKRPLLRFIRSGWTGAARTAPIVWGGDPTTDWGFDGLTSAVRNGLTMGLSGVSLWGSDVGGYFGLSLQLGSELLQRWIQVGFASGVMRTESTGTGVVKRPQIFSPDVLPNWRRYAKLRTQLFPYLAAAQEQYDRTGLPLMRQLALLYPDDAIARNLDDEYAFGPDLLVAPVLQDGARTRDVYLPAGTWVNAWRSIEYRPADGSFHVGRARVERGERALTVAAPLEELPMFIRAGAVLPLLPADVDTLSGYGSAPGLVHATDREDRRTLLAFPRGRSRSALGPGEWVDSAAGRGRWTLSLHGRRSRTYELEASLATLAAPFRPCSVTLGGRRLATDAWSWSPSSRRLTARFTTRSGRLAVRACGR